MNWFKAKTVHFTGIKGVGMAALVGLVVRQRLRQVLGRSEARTLQQANLRASWALVTASLEK